MLIKAHQLLSKSNGQYLLIALLILLLTACATTPGSSSRTYPALWRVEDPDSGNSAWLFGTIHVLPPGKAPTINFIRKQTLSRLRSPVNKPEWVSPELNQALRSASRIVLELDYKAPPVKQNTNLNELTNSNINQDIKPLFLYLDEADRQRVIKAGKQRGLHVDNLEKLSAPSTLFMLSVLPRQDNNLVKMRGVEDWLLSYVSLNRTKLSGLETPALRLEAIANTLQSVTAEQQQQAVLNYLSSALEESDNPGNALNNLYDLWLSGDLTNVKRQRELFAQYYPVIYQAFLGYRNHAWLESITQYLKNNNRVLIAVGQGHLVGPDNLRDLLIEKGYQITRIN